MITITPMAWRIKSSTVPDVQKIHIEKREEHHFVVLFHDGSMLNRHGGWTEKSMVKYYRKSCQFTSLGEALTAVKENLKACFGREP